MAQSTLPYLLSVLLALLGDEHSVHGDCLSFRRGLGIYLKNIGDDLEVVATFTFACFTEKDVSPVYFLPFETDVWAYLSLALG